MFSDILLSGGFNLCYFRNYKWGKGYRTCAVVDVFHNVIFDPENGVGGETCTVMHTVFIGGGDQSEVCLLYKIEDGNSVPGKLDSDGKGKF